MNQGKVMETAWRKAAIAVPGLYFQRMNDGTASYYGGQAQEGIRFQQRSPYDCFMYCNGTLFLLELKRHLGKSFPFSAIREQQLEHLSDACGMNTGIVAGFVVMFADVGECWFAFGNDVNNLKLRTERKSIPITWFRENGIPIEVRKLKTNWAYDVAGFVKKF